MHNASLILTSSSSYPEERDSRFFVYPGPPAGAERRIEYPQSGTSSAQPKSIYSPPTGGLGYIN